MVVNTGMAVPTVVVGLLVALVLWRSGPLGDLGLIYTLRGMVIARCCVFNRRGGPDPRGVPVVRP